MTFWHKVRFWWHAGFWPTEEVIRLIRWLNDDNNFPTQKKDDRNAG